MVGTRSRGSIPTTQYYAKISTRTNKAVGGRQNAPCVDMMPTPKKPAVVITTTVYFLIILSTYVVDNYFRNAKTNVRVWKYLTPCVHLYIFIYLLFTQIENSET
jgi:hypothetical protein